MDPGTTDGQHTRLYDTNALQRVLDTMAAGVSARLAGADQVILRIGRSLHQCCCTRPVQELRIAFNHIDRDMLQPTLDQIQAT